MRRVKRDHLDLRLNTQGSSAAKGTHSKSLYAQRAIASYCLFENMVISEHMKQRFNQGLASNLYFWLNNTGEEVDLLRGEGTHLRPIEMKSSQTFHTSYLDGPLK
jgi:predicted AAA+ superfamily ATPase